MHHVGKVAETSARDGIYDRHSREHRRLPLIGPATGSPHQEIAVVELDPGGGVDAHLHAFEQGLYLLEGEAALAVAGTEERLGADDFVWIEAGVAHSVSNAGSGSTRWLEVGAPGPVDGLDDTVFASAGAEVEVPYRRGHFDESQLPAPSDTIGLEGFGAANVGGASLTMLVDRDFGASQFNLFVVQYAPGGLIKEHDHPFEEAFFFVRGEIEAVLDGETHALGAGGYCWSGVGSMHTFVNRSDQPVRWLETPAPPPPSRH